MQKFLPVLIGSTIELVPNRCSTKYDFPVNGLQRINPSASLNSFEQPAKSRAIRIKLKNFIKVSLLLLYCMFNAFNLCFFDCQCTDRTRGC